MDGEMNHGNRDGVRNRGFRARPSPVGYDPIILGIVKDFSLLSNFVYQYTVKPASITITTGNIPSIAERANHRAFKAFSISELGNGPTPANYSYGVPATDIPAGFDPVPIPAGTPVVCIPYRSKNHGEFHYLIINTQAITGSCAV